MNRLFTACLLGCLLSLPTPAFSSASEKQKPQSTVSLQKGLFDVAHTGSDWYFYVPDSLLSREFLVTVRFASTPANTSKYGGELVNEQTVYFQKAPENKLLLRSRLLVNTADSVDAINKAIVISNEDPIIGSFKIESVEKNRYKIKVGNFFLEDNPAIGVTPYIKRSMGLQALLQASSFIESIKSFPMNTEIRMVKTWMSTQSNSYAAALTGKVTLGLNVSFVLLPKVPMQRRLFDPRVGYFADSFTYFSDNQQRVEPKRFITRWRLEPKDSADVEKMKRNELVEPKKPIVFYIDPATPKQWRPYLIQGVNDWQAAFEKAGFKNAIYAKEWPENDSTMSMEDARYSCIRYLASPMENAYGPHVHDPRSGEIIESHICWYHNVMTLVHDWYMVQAGTLDEAAQKMKFDTELMGQLIRFVSSHEVGHTLGLRHNFGASSTVPVDSLRSKSFLAKYGHTPSIMDYARFNYVAQPEDSIPRSGIFPRINDYDMWAIEWGYKPMFNAYDDVSDHWELEKLTTERLANSPRLWFGDGETNRTNDARCQTEDLGDNAMKASEYGIKNLKRTIKVLPQWTYESNDINGRNLSSLYNQVNNQFLRYCYHVLANIGSVYYNYKTIDQPGSMYEDEPKAKQEEAVAFLEQNVLTEPKWLIAESYMMRITPNPQQLVERLGTNILNSMLSVKVLDRMTATYPVDEYLPRIYAYLFSEVGNYSHPSSYRKALQRNAVTTLLNLFRAGKQKPYYPVIFKQLKALQVRLKSASEHPHFAALSDMIERDLAIVR